MILEKLLKILGFTKKTKEKSESDKSLLDSLQRDLLGVEHLDQDKIIKKIRTLEDDILMLEEEVQYLRGQLSNKQTDRVAADSLLKIDKLSTAITSKLNSNSLKNENTSNESEPFLLIGNLTAFLNSPLALKISSYKKLGESVNLWYAQISLKNNQPVVSKDGFIQLEFIDKGPLCIWRCKDRFYLSPNPLYYTAICRLGLIFEGKNQIIDQNKWELGRNIEIIELGCCREKKSGQLWEVTKKGKIFIHTDPSFRKAQPADNSNKSMAALSLNPLQEELQSVKTVSVSFKDDNKIKEQADNSENFLLVNEESNKDSKIDEYINYYNSSKIFSDNNNYMGVSTIEAATVIQSSFRTQKIELSAEGNTVLEELAKGPCRIWFVKKYNYILFPNEKYPQVIRNLQYYFQSIEKTGKLSQSLLEKGASPSRIEVIRPAYCIELPSEKGKRRWEIIYPGKIRIYENPFRK